MGKALMQTALTNPKLPNGHFHAGQLRPIIEAAELLVRAQGAGYWRSVERYRVDPQTGRLVEK